MWLTTGRVHDPAAFEISFLLNNLKILQLEKENFEFCIKNKKRIDKYLTIIGENVMMYLLLDIKHCEKFNKVFLEIGDSYDKSSISGQF